MKPIHYFYHHKLPLCQRGVGRAKLGDTFICKRGTEWRVVEVIPYGMYPSTRPNLKVRGYYREHESYIIEDSRGRQRWPVVGKLLKWERVE